MQFDNYDSEPVKVLGWSTENHLIFKSFNIHSKTEIAQNNQEGICPSRIQE